MSAPNSLKEVYLDEMQDLWSANDQMVRAVQQLNGQVSDAKLKQMLEKSVGGIQKHTDVLRSLIQANGGETKPEHGSRGRSADLFCYRRAAIAADKKRVVIPITLSAAARSWPAPSA